ncbi:MAG: hypothetical protein ACR2P1_15900 [Pseudomonadales bacterium]
MRSSLVPQQTTIEPHHQEWLVNYARDEDILIKDLWERAINELLDSRASVVEEGLVPRYAARSQGKQVPWSVKLPHPIVNRVKAAAAEDNASVRIFYYTALLDFVHTYSES